METNLAYIDEVMDRAVAKRNDGAAVLSDKDRLAAKSGAMRTVAGFRVHDEEAERKSLDAMIAKRRAGVEAFIADRKALREKLAAIDITPMAVLPTVAWEKICDATRLFRLSPDTSGRVGIAQNAFANYLAPKISGKTWGGLRRSEVSDPLDNLDNWPVDLWRALLLHMFPGYKSLPSTSQWQAQPQTVTVLLPPPPADVVDILLKASKGGIAMKVAAVAEAIGFKEDLKTVRAGTAKHYADEEERIRRLREEPFIYTEHGTSTAVLAQFGDFPIEKEVVDLIVEKDDIIPEKVLATTTIAYQGLANNVISNSELFRLVEMQRIADARMMQR